MQKEILNYQDDKIVNIYDEINLWSAPFGRLLLENIPMEKGMTIVDIGFGTGFPLIELSQRFGETSTIYGIDIWRAAIARAREKIKILGLNNIEILEESASNISIRDQSIDLVTSNLGINNFAEKEKVYAEVYRILKPNACLALTTNPIGTFQELFELFEESMTAIGAVAASNRLSNYIANRNTAAQIIEQFAAFNFKLRKRKADSTNMRFMDAESLLHHSLIRIAFRATWDQIIGAENKVAFYDQLVVRLNRRIATQGAFKMTIPLLYLEFEKVSKNKL